MEYRICHMEYKLVGQKMMYRAWTIFLIPFTSKNLTSFFAKFQSTKLLGIDPFIVTALLTNNQFYSVKRVYENITRMGRLRSILVSYVLITCCLETCFGTLKYVQKSGLFETLKMLYNTDRLRGQWFAGSIKKSFHFLIYILISIQNWYLEIYGIIMSEQFWCAFLIQVQLTTRMSKFKITREGAF